jgi:hypothetical protein
LISVNKNAAYSEAFSASQAERIVPQMAGCGVVFQKPLLGYNPFFSTILRLLTVDS